MFFVKKKNKKDGDKRNNRGFAGSDLRNMFNLK